MDDSMLSAIVGGVIGTLGTLLCGWIAYLLEKRRQERFAAAVLYNDLLSIERYLECERSSVNIRYSENWQHMVSYCSFLTFDEVKFIYNIYDEVYNYNYQYKSKEQMGMVNKGDINSYKNLREAMFNTSKKYPGYFTKNYVSLISNLKNQIKK